MKRCTQCNHIEVNDALSFCRADGTPLVCDDSSVSGGTGFASGSILELSEAETRPLTGPMSDNPAGATSVTKKLLRPPFITTLLPSQTATTAKLNVAPGQMFKALAAVLALVLALTGGAFYYLRCGRPLYRALRHWTRGKGRDDQRNSSVDGKNTGQSRRLTDRDIRRPPKERPGRPLPVLEGVRQFLLLQTLCTQATLQLRKEIPNRRFRLGHGAPGGNEKSIMTNNTVTKRKVT